MRKYMDGCDIYQSMKNYTKVLVEKLMVNKVLEKPWTHLIVNFITKLLLVAEKDMILVVCNRLLKIAHFVATTKETLAERLVRLVRLFRDNVWKLHGLLENVIFDREPQFIMELTKKLNKIGIKTKLSTLFYLQTDRQTKHINQELEQYLRFFVDHRQKNWLDWLAMVEFAVNNETHSATKVLLFMPSYSRKLRIEADIRSRY